MLLNVLSADVGKVLLKSILLGIENQERLLCVTPAERFATQVDPKLERHVESRKRCALIELGSRQIVNRIARNPDKLDDLVKADLARVETLACASRFEAGVYDRKNDRLEDRRVCRVEYN
ncbi:MAG TPA: hypothetical protein VGQ36_12640 [Thermoanaerobaculia bacterium]|nr:hypothetical protein [Thermoanaerobaculia bacterium]